MSDEKELIKSEKDIVEKSHSIPNVAPLVDIYENDDEILLHADMPGVENDKITVNVDNGTLTIRSFSVPQTIDINKVDAELKDGVLRLHLPKSEAAKPRQIEIKAG